MDHIATSFARRPALLGGSARHFFDGARDLRAGFFLDCG
jgi:hypothetical protein